MALESVCAAHSVIIVKSLALSRGRSSAPTGRHLCEHIWLLFVKKTKMHFAVRNKSNGLWEIRIGREWLKNRHPSTSAFKLLATVLNSLSSFYLSAGRQTRLFSHPRSKE